MINVWTNAKEWGTGDGDRRVAADHPGHADLLARGTFDALLRTLVTWNLVVPSTGPGRQGWTLSPDAEERLCQLEQGAIWPAEQLVYFDHRCEVCRIARPTRLLGDRYVCEACRTPPVPVPAPVAQAHRRGLLRRRRDAPSSAGDQVAPGDLPDPPQQLVS